MQAGVARVVLMVLGELRVELAIQRVGFPAVARRTRLRELGQPHVQTLMGRIRAEQPVRTSPVTKMGRVMGTSACCGYCFQADSDSSLATSAPRRKKRFILLPNAVRPASRRYEPSNTSSAPR